MSIEHTASSGTAAAPRIDRTAAARAHSGHPAGKSGGGAAAPGTAFDQLLNLLGAALGDGGAGASGDGGAASAAALSADAASTAGGAPGSAAALDGASTNAATGAGVDGAQAAVLAQCLPMSLRPADGTRTGLAGAEGGGALALQGSAAASAPAAIGRTGDGHRASARADAGALAGPAPAPGAGKDDAGSALTGAAKPAAGAGGDGAPPLVVSKAATSRQVDASQSAGHGLRDPAPAADAVMQAASQPLAAEAVPLAGARPARELDRRDADGTLIAGLQGRHGAGGASDSGLTTYALTEPDPAAATTEVAEQLSYWISAGVQNAELQVDAFGGGTVEVSVMVQGNEAQVEFRSDQPEARRLLQDAMPQLRTLLQDQGMVLSGGFVGTSAQGSDDARGQRRPDRPAARATVPVAAAEASDGVAARSRAGGAGSRLDVFV